MTLDEAIATLKVELTEIANYLGGDEAIDALKPQIQKIASKFSVREVREKLQHSDHPLFEEQILLNLMLEYLNNNCL